MVYSPLRTCFLGLTACWRDGLRCWRTGGELVMWRGREALEKKASASWW